MTTKPTLAASDPDALVRRMTETRRLGGMPMNRGHYDIRTARDGTWYCLGTPILRKPSVKLFSSVLIRDHEGQFRLETSVERGRIDVEDAPFTTVEVWVEGAQSAQILKFRSNLDHEIAAGASNPLRVVIDPGTAEPRPYLLVRDQLEALILRPVFYELVEAGVEGADAGKLGVWSGGLFFALGSIGGAA